MPATWTGRWKPHNAPGRYGAPWGRSSAASILRKAADLMRERGEAIARLATLEEGKALPEARVELNVAADIFDWYAEEGRRAYGRVLPQRIAGMRMTVVKEPVGPVAGFAPWNFPLGNPARKLGSALGAGCSVIVKPAEETPGLRAGHRAGAGGCRRSRGRAAGGVRRAGRSLAASDQLADHSRRALHGFDSGGQAAHRAGRAGHEAHDHGTGRPCAGAGVRRCGCGCRARSGRHFQVPQCRAGVRVARRASMCRKAIYERFAAGFAARAQTACRWAMASMRACAWGRWRMRAVVPAVAALIDEAVKAARACWPAAHALPGKGYFYAPTVLADVPETARIMNEEPFGPVAVLSPFRDFDEVIAQANRLPYGLAAYAFTQNARRVNLLGEQVESGMLGINSFTIAVPEAPFGGVKESGHGSEEGIEGLEACLVTKFITES